MKHLPNDFFPTDSLNKSSFLLPPTIDGQARGLQRQCAPRRVLPAGCSRPQTQLHSQLCCQRQHHAGSFQADLQRPAPQATAPMLPRPTLARDNAACGHKLLVLAGTPPLIQAVNVDSIRLGRGSAAHVALRQGAPLCLWLRRRARRGHSALTAAAAAVAAGRGGCGSRARQKCRQGGDPLCHACHTQQRIRIQMGLQVPQLQLLGSHGQNAAVAIAALP